MLNTEIVKTDELDADAIAQANLNRFADNLLVIESIGREVRRRNDIGNFKAILVEQYTRIRVDYAR